MPQTVADPLRRRRVGYGVLAWAALAGFWWLVLRRDPRTWLPELAFPFLTLLVVTVVTLIWVRHNLGIYRRKGPRRSVPVVDARVERDSLGRPVDLPVTAVNAAVVRIELDGPVKRYVVEP